MGIVTNIAKQVANQAMTNQDGGGADPQRQAVADYYQRYLGRSASDDEISWWIDGGGSLADIENGIKGSPEASQYAATQGGGTGGKSKYLDLWNQSGRDVQRFVQAMIQQQGLTATQAGDPAVLGRIAVALKSVGVNAELDSRTDGLHKGLMINGQFVKMLNGSDQWIYEPASSAGGGGGGTGGGGSTGSGGGGMATYGPPPDASFAQAPGTYTSQPWTGGTPTQPTLPTNLQTPYAQPDLPANLQQPYAKPAVPTNLQQPYTVRALPGQSTAPPPTRPMAGGNMATYGPAVDQRQQYLAGQAQTASKDPNAQSAAPTGAIGGVWTPANQTNVDQAVAYWQTHPLPPGTVMGPAGTPVQATNTGTSLYPQTPSSDPGNLADPYRPLALPGDLANQYVAPQFVAPTADQMANEPGYQTRMQAGQDVLQRSAAARGSVLSGGSQKALARYGQEYGANEYNNVYNRAANTFGVNTAAGLAGRQQNFGEYNTNVGNNLAARQQNFGEYNTGVGNDLAARQQNFGEYTTGANLDLAARQQGFGEYTTGANLGLAARQQNYNEYGGTVDRAQQDYLNRYGQWLNENARTLSDYTVNTGTTRNYQTDYWNRLLDLYRGGQSAATSSYYPGVA